jgi:hypothetical protein
MALAGGGAILIWNDIAPEGRDEFYAWHVREHIPERVAIPGFLRGSRYIAATPDSRPEFFTLYETRDVAVTTSAPYLARLNAPTEWTRRATAHFRNTSRALTQVIASAGRGHGGVLGTARFPATEAGVESFHRARGRIERVAESAALPRIAGAHLCAGDAAASGARTAETKGRSDIMAAPVGALLVEGCDAAAVALAMAATLERLGVAAEGLAVGVYALEHAHDAFAA